jgi:hypothetical protein
MVPTIKWWQSGRLAQSLKNSRQNPRQNRDFLAVFRYIAESKGLYRLVSNIHP